jgi:hypothetical protein
MAFTCSTGNNDRSWAQLSRRVAISGRPLVAGVPQRGEQCDGLVAHGPHARDDGIAIIDGAVL